MTVLLILGGILFLVLMAFTLIAADHDDPDDHDNDGFFR